MQHVERLWLLTFLRRPVYAGVLYTLLRQIFRCTASSEELVSLLLEKSRGIEHLSLLLGRTRRQEDVLLRYAVTYRQHTLEHGCRRVFADTSHLTRRTHVDTEHWVGLLQTVE